MSAESMMALLAMGVTHERTGSGPVYTHTYTVQSEAPAPTVCEHGTFYITVRDVHARDVWEWVGDNLRVLPARWWAALGRWRPMWER